MAQKLFEYAVLFHPKRSKKQEEEEAQGPKSTLLVDVTRILAKDEKVVGMLAVKQIPDSYSEKLDQVEIIVRPF